MGKQKGKPMFKKRSTITLLLLGLTLGSIQAQAPGWFLDKELEYPASQYIAATGEGKTRVEAETAATAGVSMFFKTKTEIRNEAIREFNESVINNTTDFSQKTYISENAVIRSEEEFLGIRFASPWLDPQRQTWAALAYINRREAAGIYESKINTNFAIINALMDDAAKETEALYVCGLLYKGLRIGDITEEYINTAAVVSSGATEKYAPVLRQIQKLRSDYRARRSALTFTVKVDGPDTMGRIERKLQELLEGNGYVIAMRNPQYTVLARFTAKEEAYSSGVYIRSGISVRVERADSALFSYGKNYDRVTSRNTDGAYSRAFLAVEEDLEENFITKLTAMLGR
jgi:hypothetical protein